MSKDGEDIFEKAFGKAPDEGYIFRSTEVELVDNTRFKGFILRWSAQGIGFGEVFYGFGLGEDLKQYNQHGFHCSTECMSAEFVAALLDECGPQMVDLLMKHKRD